MNLKHELDICQILGYKFHVLYFVQVDLILPGSSQSASQYSYGVSVIICFAFVSLWLGEVKSPKSP